jgi:hypothetical protein
VTFEKPIFDLKVSNLPIVNVRGEFATYTSLLADSDFVKKLYIMNQPIELPLLIWRDLPKNLLTFMLQRSILGIESCMVAAVEYELQIRGKLDAAMAEALDDLFGIPGSRGTAEAFYNKLPGLVDPRFQLLIMDVVLWQEVRSFYKEVRNNLFHGYQLQGTPVQGVKAAMEMLGKVYAWLDSWCLNVSSGIRRPAATQ